MKRKIWSEIITDLVDDFPNLILPLDLHDRKLRKYIGSDYYENREALEINDFVTFIREIEERLPDVKNHGKSYNSQTEFAGLF